VRYNHLDKHAANVKLVRFKITCKMPHRMNENSTGGVVLVVIEAEIFRQIPTYRIQQSGPEYLAATRSAPKTVRETVVPLEPEVAVAQVPCPMNCVSVVDRGRTASHPSARMQAEMGVAVAVEGTHLCSVHRQMLQLLLRDSRLSWHHERRLLLQSARCPGRSIRGNRGENDHQVEEAWH
jgi:hypothetical protein